MTRQEALAEIIEAEADMRFYQEQLAAAERRLFNARLATGDWMMNAKGALVRVQVA